MKFLECVIVNPTIEFEKEKIYPFIDMACVSTTFRLPDTIAYKGYDSGVKFANGDTVVARIEPCLQNGKRFYVKNFDKGFGSTEFLVFRPKDEKLDSLYLYYLLNTNYIRQSMINSMTGATGRQRVNNDIFKSLEFELPDIDVQRKIASILSSYDDLIENNQKQIKLLEEAAQRLYKEWFVNMRFPGHEDVEIVDGLPRGWERCLLSEIADVKAGGDRPIEFSKVKTEMFGVPIYSNGIDEEGLYGYTDKAVVEMECVTISARGTVGAAFYRDTPFVPIVRLLTVVPTNRFDAVFLYHLLKNTTFNSNGAAQQQLTIPMLEKTEIILPSIEIAVRYSFIAKELYVQRKFLKAIIDMLVEARDRLLPKLMSGEVEV